MEYIKLKKTKEYYQCTCPRCDKKIIGSSLKHLRHNFKIHQIFCKGKNIEDDK